ncbi:hypothetical protein [Paraburkholderia acidisoli]|uniref:Uncharacterized protein n=1 Tax=Paraburkholderia acidisoli TaxID=2571748 RepID=A0A7Z2GHW5_9BURK|nr:hypothetical protein [Paraburkholderia acidisoli]QGZ62116.1 hypothetical protein FAZ98_10455 [Paraburkholderia acidisoli]
MAQRNDASFFDRLIAPMLKHLRQIAGASQGEHSVDDLKSEAWIIAEEVKAERGGAVEPEDADLQETVVTRLHKLFGRFVNRAMRFAARLDHEDRDDDGDYRENAISARLAAPQNYEPEIAIELAEEAAEAARVMHAQFSEAVAYYHVFDQFDGDSGAIARHFAIQPATLDARLARADVTARRQPSVFDGVATVPPNFRPHRGKRRPRHAPVRFRRVCGSMRPAQKHLFFRYGAVFH